MKTRQVESKLLERGSARIGARPYPFYTLYKLFPKAFSQPLNNNSYVVIFLNNFNYIMNIFTMMNLNVQSIRVLYHKNLINAGAD